MTNLTDTQVDEIVIEKLNYLLNSAMKIKFTSASRLVLKGFSIVNFMKKSETSDPNFKYFLADNLLYSLTGDPDATDRYYNKISDTVLTYEFIPTFKEIVKEYYINYELPVTENLVLLHTIFNKVHRSGWNYVVNGIANANLKVTKPLTIDTFVDKTFHWKSDFYQSTGLIPYKTDWIGFVHHPMDTENGFDVKRLTGKRLFNESLYKCKGLIVLSEDLKYKLDNYLQGQVKVFNLTHPMEYTPVCFTVEKFIKNKNKKIVQIGKWLRDMFAIYRLQLPSNSQLKKCLLKGFKSQSYLPPTDFDVEFQKFLDSIQTGYTPKYDICNSSLRNEWIASLKEFLKESENSVNVIETLSDTDYDDLLSRNIVFLKLTDAVAVNTLLECFIRNTPVLINKLPAVIELFGEDYPFYYTSFSEATEKLTLKNIQATCRYLSNKDKTKVSLIYFQKSLQNIINLVQDVKNEDEIDIN